MQRSEVILLDECSFQSRLKAGLERPRMQWALVGAKRLECGSLLPLCFYAQTTCLEPDRHDAENNVSVPISASPADALEETPTLGSAAVPGRINLMTDLTTRFDHANPTTEL
ncbi:MAG TPA: hypothetical protein PLW35_05730 [Verrucomicrobiota bacterium]|nr:hypothetical protein [Verrucomicrobiota bacterium]